MVVLMWPLAVGLGLGNYRTLLYFTFYSKTTSKKVEHSSSPSLTWLPDSDTQAKPCCQDLAAKNLTWLLLLLEKLF